MARSSDANQGYSKGYSRGYYAGMTGKWPSHKPPTPPQEQVAAAMLAAQALADAVHDWCCMFGDDDTFTQQMRPLIEAHDKAQTAVSEWLVKPCPDCADIREAAR